MDTSRALKGYNLTAVAAATTSAPITTREAASLRLTGTVDCIVAVGSNPQASASSGILLPAFSPEYFAMRKGDRISVVRAGTNDGSLNVVEVA